MLCILQLNYCPSKAFGLGFMVLNATFNIISATLYILRSVLLVEETGALGENYQPVKSHCLMSIFFL